MECRVPFPSGHRALPGEQLLLERHVFSSSPTWAMGMVRDVDDCNTNPLDSAQGSAGRS